MPQSLRNFILSSVFALSALLPVYTSASEVDLAAMLELGDLTGAPGIYDVNGNATTWSAVATAAKTSVQPIYYDGIDYLSSPTRVFALIKLPATASSANQVPGVVLVHGGGGTAISAWVEKWAERGYAAIAMDNEGGDVINGVRTRPHAHGGPKRTGIYKDSEPENLKPLDEQWEYHATSTVILANSLLRSLPEVDASKVGVTGVSWGGVLTSTAIGIDDRFAFAIPVYGCGRLFDVGNQYGTALGDNVFYQTVMDPIIRIGNATMPTLWSSWPKENNFSLDSQAGTYYRATSSQRMVSLVPGLGHGHGSSYLRQEPYDFADSIIATGSMWGQQQSLSLTGSLVEVVFTSTKPLFDASLIYTTGTGYTGDLTWPEITVDSLVESPAGTWTVTATLPADATAWFVNVKALGTDVDADSTAATDTYGYRDENLIMTSDYQEVLQVNLSPSNLLALDLEQSSATSSSHVSFSFTGPTNLEVVSITIAGESEVGAFTVSPNGPFVLNNIAPFSTTLGVQFDNTVAGLNLGETATASLVLTWEEVDGSLSSANLPFSSMVRVPATIIFDTTADWSSKTISGIDDVIVRNGAAVRVDQFSNAASLTVSDEATPSSGNLLIDEDFSLSVRDSIHIGLGSGAGAIMQTTGSVTTSDLAINSSGTGDVSTYTLNGGSLSILNSLDINAFGSFQLNGGFFNMTASTFAIDGSVLIDGGSWVSSGLSLAGDGAFYLKSGSVLVSGAVSPSIDLMEISGGSIDFGTTHVQIGKGGPSEFRVVGDQATIQMKILNQQTGTGREGTFRFVFNETGISPIQVSSYMHLTLATVIVDGSAYTGGPAAFPLIDAASLILLGNLDNFSSSGFDQYGLEATFDQDQAAGADWLQIVLTENAYATWASNEGLTGADTHILSDPDLDSVENLLEYVLNRDPLLQEAEDLPVMDAPGSDFVFTFTRVEASDAITTQVFEYGSSLAGWNEINITEPIGAGVSIGAAVDGLQVVTVTVSKSLAVGDKMFGRLKVALR